jgi:hypothetical protein
VPGAEKLVLTLARWDATTAGDPMTWPFCENVTVPVGLPPFGTVRMAVKVTCSLSVDGFVPDCTASVMTASFTTWFIAADVLVNEDASPP